MDELDDLIAEATGRKKIAAPRFDAPVTSGFDDRRDGGRRQHGAYDLGYREGTPLTMNRPGRVAQVGENAKSGKFVRIDHGDGLVTSHAHLQSVDLPEGAEVTPGVPFGRVGRTGTTRPHNHFSTFRDGQRIRAEEHDLRPQRAQHSDPLDALLSEVRSAPPAQPARNLPPPMPEAGGAIEVAPPPPPLRLPAPAVELGSVAPQIEPRPLDALGVPVPVTAPTVVPPAPAARIMRPVVRRPVARPDLAAPLPRTRVTSELVEDDAPLPVGTSAVAPPAPQDRAFTGAAERVPVLPEDTQRDVRVRALSRAARLAGLSPEQAGAFVEEAVAQDPAFFESLPSPRGGPMSAEGFEAYKRDGGVPLEISERTSPELVKRIRDYQRSRTSVQQAPPPPTAEERVNAARNAFVQGASRTVGATATGLSKISEVVPVAGAGNDIRRALVSALTGRDDHLVYSDVLQQATDAVAPDDPRLRDSFVFNQLPRGAGSLAALAAGGVIGGGSRAAVAGVGALTGFGETYEEAKRAGADEDTATIAATLGGLIGTTEAIGAGSAINRLNRLSGGKFTRQLVANMAKRGAGREALKEVAEEGGQEAFQTVASDAIARAFYDTTREFSLERTAEAAAVGAILGGVASGGVSTVNRNASTDTAAPVERPAAARPPSLEESLTAERRAETQSAINQRVRPREQTGVRGTGYAQMPDVPVPTPSQPRVVTRVRHSDPRIDGGEVVRELSGGRLEVRNNEGGTSVIQHPRRRGNREAALVREEVQDETVGEVRATASEPDAGTGAGVREPDGIGVEQEAAAQARPGNQVQPQSAIPLSAEASGSASEGSRAAPARPDLETILRRGANTGIAPPARSRESWERSLGLRPKEGQTRATQERVIAESRQPQHQGTQTVGQEAVAGRRDSVEVGGQVEGQRQEVARPRGLARNYRAGTNDATLRFASEDQRDLYDLGARLRARRSGSVYDTRRTDSDPLLSSLTSRLGKTPAEVTELARSVHDDVRSQMRGVKHLEERALADNVTPAARQGQEVAPAATGFTTAQGSSYTVSGRSTRRTKTPHKDHDPKDVGLKRPSERTVYLDEQAAREVGMWNTMSNAGKRVIVRGDEVLLTSINPKTGVRGLDGRFKFTETPEVGRSPLELFDPSESLKKEGHEGYRGNHPGNRITEVRTAAPTPATATAPAPRETFKQSIKSAAPRLSEQQAEATTVLADAIDKWYRRNRPDLPGGFYGRVAGVERGGTPREDALSQTAWHGSPHRFDRFSSEKIGTGEGAQAYGHGLYFTDKREIAEFYKQKLGETRRYDGQTYDNTDPRHIAASRLRGNKGDRAATVAELRSNARGSSSEINRRLFKQAADVLVANSEAKIEATKTGALYRVDLAPAEDEYLLWDKPLSKQGEKVKAALAADPRLRELDADDTTGDKLYGYLVGHAAGGNRRASERLRSLGVRGIKYLDGDSRIDPEISRSSDGKSWGVLYNSGPGTRSVREFATKKEARQFRDELAAKQSYNYVIFDDADVRIEEVLEQRRKAAVEFLSDGRAVIRAFEKADVSSIAHETSHIFRRDLTPDLLRKAEQWAGVKPGEKWPEEAEEKFARGFERYLKEGYAPSVELRTVFQQFKEWLTEIYGAIRGKSHELNVKLTPEIREVWDTVLGAPKGEHGQFTSQLYRSGFFSHPAVRRALRVKPIPADASSADVSARQTEAADALTKTLGEVRASRVEPERIREWAKGARLPADAVKLLDAPTEAVAETPRAEAGPEEGIGWPHDVELTADDKLTARYVHEGDAGSADSPLRDEGDAEYYKAGGIWHQRNPEGRGFAAGWRRITDPQFSTQIERWSQSVAAPATAEPTAVERALERDPATFERFYGGRISVERFKAFAKRAGIPEAEIEEIVRDAAQYRSEGEGAARGGAGAPTAEAVEPAASVPAPDRSAGRRADVAPPAVERPTKREAKASVKTEKVDARTGLTATQKDYLSAELQTYAQKHFIGTPNYPTDSPVDSLKAYGGSIERQYGERETIKVPGDGEFTVPNVEAANRLHRKIAGKPIEGLPAPSRASTIKASSASGYSTKNADANTSVEEVSRAYGGDERALAAMRRLKAQREADPEAVEQMGGNPYRVDGLIEELQERVNAKRDPIEVREPFADAVNARLAEAPSFPILKDKVDAHIRKSFGRGRARQELAEQEIARMTPERYLEYESASLAKDKVASRAVGAYQVEVRRESKVPFDYKRQAIDWFAVERQAKESGGDVLYQSSPSDVASRVRGAAERAADVQSAQSDVQSEPTSAPAFRRWFAGSKAVDDQGNPLVLYHGGRRFDAFSERPEAGVHFATDDIEAATSYAGQYRTAEAEIKPLYVRMRKPLDLRDPAAFRRWLGVDPAKGEYSNPRRNMAANGPRSGDPVFAKAREAGYDGVIFFDTDASNRGQHTSYAFFDAAQAKSAGERAESDQWWDYPVRTEPNRGTFDPESPNILYQSERPRRPSNESASVRLMREQRARIQQGIGQGITPPRPRASRAAPPPQRPGTPPADPNLFPEESARKERTPILETITALRRAGLLTSLKMHARNLASNTTFAVTEEMARPVTVLGDMLASRKTGYRTHVTPSPVSVARAVLGKEGAVIKGTADFWKVLRAGDPQANQKYERTEMSSGLRVLDAYVNFTMNSVQASDRWAKAYQLSRALDDLAVVEAKNEGARNVRERARELRENPTEWMAREAEVRAEIATFQDANAITEAISKAKGKLSEAGPLGRAARFALELKYPFTMTPANVFQRILEYTPAGVPVAAYRYRRIGRGAQEQAARDGLTKEQARYFAESIAGQMFTKAEQARFSETFGRAGLGTAIGALAVVLMRNDLLDISGVTDFEDEKERAQGKRAVGVRDGSLRVPGTDIRFVVGGNPLGSALVALATAYEQAARPGTKYQKAKATAKGAVELAKQQPLLRPELEGGTDRRTIEERGANLLASFIPRVAGEIGDVRDPKQRKYWGEGAAAQFRVKSPLTGPREKLAETKNPIGGPAARGDALRRALRLIDPFETTTQVGATPRPSKPLAGEKKKGSGGITIPSPRPRGRSSRGMER